MIRNEEWKIIKQNLEMFTFLKVYNNENHIRLGSAKFLESGKKFFRGYSFQNIPKFLKIFHLLRPFYVQLISITFSKFYSDILNVEKLLYGLIQEIAGPFIIDIIENDKMRAYSPLLNLPIRTYSIYWQGWQIPISQRMISVFKVYLKFNFI